MCTGTCDGKCVTKSAQKSVEVSAPNIARMYGDGRGVNFSMAIIATNVARSMGQWMRDFRLSEDADGEVIVHTGFKRAADRKPPAALPCGELCDKDSTCACNPVETAVH